MHVHGAGAAVVVVTPDLVQQLVPREHASRVLGQVFEQLEFLVGQVQRLPAHPGGVAGFVNDDAGGMDFAAGLLVRVVGMGDDLAQPRFTSAGPAVSRTTSSASQFADTAAMPPSVGISISGALRPVALSSWVSERAPT